MTAAGTLVLPLPSVNPAVNPTSLHTSMKLALFPLYSLEQVVGVHASITDRVWST